MLEDLKEKVCEANIELQARKLVLYSWGNVSGIDREKNVIAIKPSGVSYDELTAEKITLVDIDGNVVEGDMKPSSDTDTHLELYRNFRSIGGVCHTHSTYATMWAQACRDLPCFGTTHADNFYGDIPVTGVMAKEKVENEYELNTGKVIVERFKDIDPSQMSAVLVANHGPFTWGDNPDKAVENAVVLEQSARMAIGTLIINKEQQSIADYLLDKHYLRKHGKNAYYGQD